MTDGVRGGKALVRAARDWAATAWYLTPIFVFAMSRLVVLLVWGVLSTRGYPMAYSARSWDGGWYLSIARAGYTDLPLGGAVVDPQQQLVFLPVVPFGARAISELTPLGLVEAGVLLSLVSGCLGVVLLWRLVERRMGAETATVAMTLLVLSPAAYVLSMFYTEGMTLFAVGAFFTALDRRRWQWVAAAGLLAGITRPTGFLLAVPCLVVVLADRRRDGRVAWRGLAAAAAAPAAFSGWVLYTAHRTGELGGYFRLQREVWGSRLDGGVNTVRTVFDLFTWSPASTNHLVNALGVVFIGCAGCVLAFRTTMPREWAWFAVATTVVTFAGAQQVSGTRYLLPAFALFVGWAARTPRALQPLLVGLSATAMGAFAVLSATPIQLTP